MISILKIENIKGRTATYELGKTNLITGPNGAGKSAIIESIIMAIDGEHPVTGKTNAAMCSVVSGEKGMVELSMEKPSGESIVIRRIFINGDTKTQKISIDGKEMLQSAAQAKIMEFMGGATIRKMSPYRFMNSLPKERLDILSSIIPASSSGSIESQVAKDLCSGSSELTARVRYSIGRPIDSLDMEELMDAVEKSEPDDPVYLGAVRTYLISQGSYDAPSYVDKLIEKNKIDIRESQAEINRLRSSVQASQDALGTEVSESIESLDEQIADADKRITEHAAAAAMSAAYEEQRKKLESLVHSLGVDYDEAKKQYRAIIDEALPYEPARDVDGEEGQLKLKIYQAEASLKTAAESSSIIKKAAPDIKLLKEELESLKSRKAHLEDDLEGQRNDHASISAAIDAINESISRLGKAKGGKCPTCKSPIDREVVMAKLKKEADEHRARLESATSLLERTRATIAEAVADMGSRNQLLLRHEVRVGEAKKNELSDLDRDKITRDLELYRDTLKKVEDRNKYRALMIQAESIGQKIAQIDQLNLQISEAKPDVCVSQEYLDKARGEKVALGMAKKRAIELATIKNIVAQDQVRIKEQEERRTALKKIGSILAECKEKTYWFIPAIKEKLSQWTGAVGTMSNDVFGITKEGITVTDKALSGGEKIMFFSSLIFAALDMSDGVKIVEIEGSELDSNNISKLVHAANASNIDMGLITTHMNIKGENCHTITPGE